MRYLVDTQAVIWMLESDPKLSANASLAIKNVQNEHLVYEVATVLTSYQ